MTVQATTRTLTLDAEQAALLCSVVGDALTSLRLEIDKTVMYELRQELTRREAVLNGIASTIMLTVPMNA